MNSKPVGPISSSDSSLKKERTSPNSKKFQEMMKVDKTQEVDLEEQKKKKLPPKEKEGEKKEAAALPEKEKEPSPYEAAFYKKPKEALPSKEETFLPSKSPKELSLEEEEALFLPPDILEEKKKAQTLVVPKEKKIEEKKSKIEEKKELPASLLSLEMLPKSVTSQATAFISKVQASLPPDFKPLLETMVGSLIHLSARGIEKTELVLNSPSFASSLFFGCKITLERYSTAPDSFNILLTGPAQAIELFKEHSSSLLTAFQKKDFSFHIGRLSAEYETERPLFRRKEPKEGFEEEKKEKENR